jgi:hypothetical protein
MTYQLIAFLDDPPRLVIFDDLDRRETQRVDRYKNLLRRVECGQISRDTFRQTVRKWAPFRGSQLLSDPDAAMTFDELRHRGHPDQVLRCKHQWDSGGTDGYHAYYTCGICGADMWTDRTWD